MDQVKIGGFLRDLRKEKGFTQEQLAEQFGISRRTVSRWETGSNMPDLDLLIEMADFYDVELRELLDGERKSEKMDQELKKTVLQVADYSNEEKQKLTRRMHLLFVEGLIAAVIYMALLFTDHADNAVGDFCLGFIFGLIIIGVIMTSKHAAKIRETKLRILHRMKS
ncbi:MAG: helix-turn-helix domain-containing protein [Anaerovoracaceae bacterium]